MRLSSVLRDVLGRRHPRVTIDGTELAKNTTMKEMMVMSADALSPPAPLRRSRSDRPGAAPPAGQMPGLWYLASASSAVKNGQMIPLAIFGQDVLLGRSAAGELFGYHNRCPHRGMKLSHGRLRDDRIECCFHGWQFDVSDGSCCHIPALLDHHDKTTGRLRLTSMHVAERYGQIWMLSPRDESTRQTGGHALSAQPVLPMGEHDRPQISTVMRFPCDMLTAVTGFIDPAHPAFVHTSRWWRGKGDAELRLKQKHFEPTDVGFRMHPHDPAAAARPYRLLGRDVRIQIDIRLPGIRIEHIAGARYSACVVAAATPVAPGATDVHYAIYWTVPWLAPAKPILARMTRKFLRQDYDVAAKLGPDHDASSDLLVGDPDRQILWFRKLQREFLESYAEGRPFTNPLTQRSMSWRS